MMHRLPLIVPLGDREAPQDFLSRLAVRNCRDGMRNLAADVRLDCQALIDGDQKAVARLAELGAVDPRSLHKEAFVRDGTSSTYLHRGQAFGRQQLSRDGVRMCLACMREDIESSTVRIEARPWRRSQWLVSQIRTCDRHGRALVHLGGSGSGKRTLDTSAVIATWVERLDMLEERSLRRSPSNFERYVLDRLEGISAEPFLDALPINVVLRTCTLAGASAVHGPDVRFDDLGEDELWECDSAGFDVLRDGAGGISRLLERMMIRFRDGYRTWGANSLFGPIYQGLAKGNSDPSFDPIRDIIADRIIDLLPVGPGDQLFGREVMRRRWHSARTAAVEHRIGVKKLVPLLVDGGVLPVEAVHLSPERMLFEAAPAKSFLEDAFSAISFEAALARISIPREQMTVLLESGVVVPWIPAGKGVARYHSFLPKALDEFMTRLLRNADERFGGDPAFFNIRDAARKCMRGADVIVRLVLDGRLQRVGRRSDVAGFLSVLVDTAEVDRVAEREPPAGMTARAVAEALNTTADVARHLIGQGHLETVQGRAFKTARRVRMVPRDAVDRFDAEFVSLSALSERAGKWHIAVMWELERLGVRPAFPHPIRFYRRRDVDISFP